MAIDLLGTFFIPRQYFQWGIHVALTYLVTLQLLPAFHRKDLHEQGTDTTKFLLEKEMVILLKTEETISHTCWDFIEYVLHTFSIYIYILYNIHNTSQTGNKSTNCILLDSRYVQFDLIISDHFKYHCLTYHICLDEYQYIQIFVLFHFLICFKLHTTLHNNNTLRFDMVNKALPNNDTMYLNVMVRTENIIFLT